MARNVSVLFVHGINVSTQDYAKPAIKRLTNSLPKSCRPYVTFGSAYWADIVRQNQRTFFQKAQSASDIKETLSRRLALEGLGDAAAYQKTPKRLDAPYFRIQRRVGRALEALDASSDPNRPLVVIGHSLGCHILSSFVWDVNNIKQYTPAELANQDDLTKKFHGMLVTGSPFRRFDTLAGIVTMGNNMPLFTFTFDRQDVTPITKSRHGKIPAFPGSGLPSEITSKSRWLNFYSRNDLLAYPLKPLYELDDNYKLIQDVAVQSEGWWRSSSWLSPLNAFAAHTRYDRHPTVIGASARLLQDIIEA